MQKQQNIKKIIMFNFQNNKQTIKPTRLSKNQNFHEKIKKINKKQQSAKGKKLQKNIFKTTMKIQTKSIKNWKK
jgi:hypothetical protein